MNPSDGILLRGRPDEADALIRANVHLTDGQISAVLRSHGIYRTPHGIQDRRVVLGLQKARGANSSPEARQAAIQGLQRAKMTLQGWPVLRGNHKARDRAFAAMVITAALAEGIITRGVAA